MSTICCHVPSGFLRKPVSSSLRGAVQAAETVDHDQQLFTAHALRLPPEPLHEELGLLAWLDHGMRLQMRLRLR